jgi:hypothetical protein
MELHQASRKRAKMKMAIQGPSGSGKTMGALHLAFGLCNDWSKIAVVDSENHSSELYDHLGPYQVLHFESPFTPERYIEAIQTCERAGIEVIVIDSISHEWEGSGGILEAHSNMTGNSYTNWSKLTPRHNSFVQYILQSRCHIIGTIRAKQEYVLSEKNGKQVPEKVGMKGITRGDIDYEFTLVFQLDMKHNAAATKDRTSLFANAPEFKLTDEVGKKILQWCDEGVPDNKNLLIDRINDCKSLDDLLKLYYQNPTEDKRMLGLYSSRKKEFEKLLSTSKEKNNGTYHDTTTGK